MRLVYTSGMAEVLEGLGFARLGFGREGGVESGGSVPRV